MEEREILHYHLFCGLGGGALGFNRGRAELNGIRGRFRCIGGVDVSPSAVRDFERISGARGTVLDLFDREQYRAFHEAEPPAGWREAGPAEIHRSAGGERPHIVFLSAPCKGFSGLLSETRSKSSRYQALNRLTLRGIFLMLEAWSSDPPELVIFENVPRIATRGRPLLDQITALLRHYGYAVAETFHDCGEIGGLAQSRKRFLMVARHAAKVPPFLYEPPKRPLRAVGEILERMPLPGDMRGGPMHAVPNLQWKTWVRLAFVEAGSDWRSLNKLRVVDGKLADYLLVPEYRRGYLGVNRWDEASGTVQGRSTVTNGAFAVADPRHPENKYGALAVERWNEASRTIVGQRAGNNLFVQDPRINGVRHNNVFRIVKWEQHSPSVTGGGHPNSGGICVADPRPGWDRRGNNLVVEAWSEPSRTVIGGGKGVQGGWLSVADPRPAAQRGKGDAYLTNGNYGVVPWDHASGAVSAAACADNGRWSVANPRLPEASEKLVGIIRALDGHWHRPFTTLELAALQSLVDPDAIFDLDGNSDSAHRERIGNAVPPQAAQAIADTMGRTLLMAWTGETFALSAIPIWVQPVAVALSVQPQAAAGMPPDGCEDLWAYA
jgi:site-specific DNA-cytosine methylase